MRARVLVGAAALLAMVVCGGGVAAFLLWPQAHLGEPGDALTRVALPRFAGRLAGVEVRSANGRRCP